MTNKTLIKCGWLISCDPRVKEIENAAVLIEDGVIREVAADAGAINDKGAEQVDASDMIVMPGLVNAHIHVWQSALRGLGSEWISADYHKYMHGNMATRYAAEDVYLGNVYGALAQLNGGVTTVLDWCHAIRDLEMAEAAIDGLEEAGIRAVFGHGTAKPPTHPGNVPFSHVPHPRDRVETLRKGRLSKDDGLITLAMAILGPEYGTWDVTLKDFNLARELDLLSSAHVWHGYNRNLPDAEVKDGYAKLAEMKLLGPDHNVVHGNYMPDEQIRMMLDAGVSITSTVLTEAHGHGAEPLVNKVRDYGALPSIGNDTALIVSDDFFSEMRTALVIARYRDHQKNRGAGNEPLADIPITSREALEWATTGGAKALMLDEAIGSITPGKQADLIMLRAKDMNLYPVHDPVWSVAEQATSGNVDSVMVQGRFVKRHGQLLFDGKKLDRIRGRLAGSAERIMQESSFKPSAA